MKRCYTVFSLALLLASSALAQNIKQNHKTLKPQSYEIKTKLKAKTGFEETITQASVPSSYMSAASRLENQIGHTYYDLQTNSSMPRRVVNRADGGYGASFTFATDAGYADRGTGYNSSNSSEVWGPEPNSRIENVRTGFGNLVILDNGTEVSVSHPGSGGPVVSLKAAGSSTWNESTLPSPAPGLWYRAAASGSNIHIIGITIPVANAGAIYQGVDGHMLYWRSKDGGATWDKQGVIIPGLDSTLFKSLGGDSYAIDAQGDHVAFAIFNDWNDSVVFESEDNGDTWEKHIFWDFPLDNYVADTGYDTTAVPADPNTPQQGAIRTTDESGSILIDDADIIHVSFGSRYVIDVDLADGNTSIFSPVTDLLYCNSLDWEALQVVGYPLDLNGNDTLDMASTTYEWYNGRCTESYPILTLDSDSRLTILYAGTREGTADQAGFHFRHIYRVISQDLGTSWTTPQDLIDENSVGDQVLADLTEACYPSAPRRSGNRLCFTYQADYDAGIGVQDDHADVENYIKCYCLPTSNATNVAPEALKFIINPNPANLIARVSFTANEAGRGLVELLDITGRVILATPASDIQAGPQQMDLNTTNLSNGLYFVRLTLGEVSSTRKLAIQH